MSFVVALLVALAVSVGPVSAVGAPRCQPLSEQSGTRDGTGRPSGLVPDVKGQTRTDAIATLESSGFRAVPEPSDAADDWKVSEQDPAAFAIADCGSEVRITLSSGQVEVPNVVGQSADVAQAEIEEQGLVVEVDDAAVSQPAEVSDQDPAAGTLVDPGSTVLIRLRAAAVTPSPETTPTPEPTPEPTSEPTPEGSTAEPQPSDEVITREPQAVDTTEIEPDEVAWGSVIPVVLLVGVVFFVGLALLVRPRKRPASAQVISCVPYHDLAPFVELHEVGPVLHEAAPMPDIRLEPHHDPGHQELREIVR